MSLGILDPSLKDEERQCVRGRLGITLVIIVLIALTTPLMADSRRWVGLACLAVTLSCTAFVVARAHSGEVRRSMKLVLVPDLLVLLALSTQFRQFEDGFYPMAIMLAVAYALVLDEAWAWTAGLTSAVAYAAGHLVHHAVFDPAHLIMFGFKVVAIPVVGVTVGHALREQRAERLRAFSAVEERDELNERLERRIGELQAVRQITEILHSSLDIDEVGPEVAGILARTIGVSACCIFVMGKARHDDAFCVTYGMDVMDREAISTLDWTSAEGHFTCTPIFDHPSALVSFCSLAEEIERISDEDRLVLGAIASELVVAVENSRLYKLTRTLADTDELTGLHNYRYLQQRMDEEVDRSRRYGAPLSLLMIDLDDFKGFNDRYGHIAGDVALAEFGRVVRSVIRETDVLVRYGGEEFSILLPETDAAGAFIAAEKVRDAVANHLFEDANGERTCNLTVSIGLSAYPAHALDKEQLLHKADDALYTAKTGGRNRVRTPSRDVA